METEDIDVVCVSWIPLYHCQSHPFGFDFLICVIRKAASGFIGSGLWEKPVCEPCWKPFCLPPECEADKNVIPSLLLANGNRIYWCSLCELNPCASLPKPSLWNGFPSVCNKNSCMWVYKPRVVGKAIVWAMLKAILSATWMGGRQKCNTKPSTRQWKQNMLMLFVVKTARLFHDRRHPSGYAFFSVIGQASFGFIIPMVLRNAIYTTHRGC